MAEKKVPQEPCMLCGHNPCDCGKPRSRKQELKKHPLTLDEWAIDLSEEESDVFMAALKKEEES
jgi:hypothetical protein